MADHQGTFQNFLARIETPALREVASHWNEARAARRMPAWRDIDPLKIVKHLPMVWSWRYDRATEDFIGRLSGTAIDAVFGRSLRGIKHKDFFRADNFAELYARHHRVVTEPCFARDCGAVFRHVDAVGLGERIVMPLAEDGELGDGIFGATYYNISQFRGSNDSRVAADNLEFLPL